MTGLQELGGSAIDDETVTEMLSVIRADVRRAVLQHLCDQTRHATLNELADVVSSQSTSTRTTKVTLYHQHLPALAEHDIIQFDKASNVVCRGDRFDSVKPLLNACIRIESGVR